MRKHFTSNYRKMNEADKERYFREKEAYERITGHVLPVAKVGKKRMDLFFSFTPFRSSYPILLLTAHLKIQLGPQGQLLLIWWGCAVA